MLRKDGSLLSCENTTLVLNLSRILAFGCSSCYAGKEGMESGSPPIEEVKQRWTYPFWAPQSWVESDPCLSLSLELFHRLRVVFVVSLQHDGDP